RGFHRIFRIHLQREPGLFHHLPALLIGSERGCIILATAGTLNTYKLNSARVVPQEPYVHSRSAVFFAFSVFYRNCSISIHIYLYNRSCESSPARGGNC